MSSKKYDEHEDQNSQAASRFLEQRKTSKYKNAVLVGTGDNFAPQLEARIFSPAPDNTKPYIPANKELYNWYQKEERWVPIEDPLKDLRELLARGEGKIPTDNVGCFLAAARFAAVVPGKQDFYFGAERVRQLARFMAGIKQKGYKPVQMLGANLVIQTTSVDNAPVASHAKPGAWPKKFSVLNLQSVYPWFSYVRVKIMDLQDGELLERLKEKLPKQTDEASFQLLLSKIDVNDKDTTELKDRVDSFLESGVYVCDPDQIGSCKRSLKERRVRLAGNTIVYDLAVDPEKVGQFSTVTAGRTYGLCLGKKEVVAPETCLRFTVHTPFFYAPNPDPVAGRDPEPYVEPYVFLEKENTAIFGVVDQNIGAHVGALNFSWRNKHDGLKTTVVALKPEEALQQQLEYFARRHPGFTGLKILLAQMSPPVARLLAAVFPEFQVVVTEADQELATSETELTSVWSPSTGARAGTFVAVPSPYFESGQREPLEGTVHFGLISALKTKAANQKDSWRLGSEISTPREIEKSTGSKPSNSFQTLIAEGLSRCVSTNFPAHKTRPERIEALSKSDQPLELMKRLTLCAMREQLGADVALVQKRDFFYQLSKEASDAADGRENQPVDVQQVLDRIIWKGDLLTLLYVPGAALKKALTQSKKFDNEDANALSLADERGRGLVYLGIKETEKEYLINEAPLDEKRLYAVATTDYIGAGDTGYPDLATAALDQKTYPAQFPKQLRTISSVVCGELYPNDRLKHCLDKIPRDDYLDEVIVEIASPRRAGFGSWLRDRFPFKLPSKDSSPERISEAIEQKVQHRWIRTLSLRNFSFSLLNLSNNLTDAQLGQKFAGISTSGVTAKKSRAMTVGLDTRISVASHRNEFFIALGMDYNQLSTGDVAPRISQLKNRMTGDAGVVRNIRGGRSKDRVGVAFALHAEMPLQKPFTTFTLGTQEPLKITQSRNVLLLPRIGLRWQNGANFFEVGGQVGREIRALSGYRFNTQGSIVECLPSATQTFAACITRLSTPPMMAITKDSVATAILQSRPRAGLYWKYGLSIPLGSKVKYELNQEESQEADFFFNFHQDNAADTRFLDRSKHSLKFAIWPSFSIGPTLRLLLYQNKVNRDFLFQKQFGFEANFSFNLFNHREKAVQIKYKP